ncbi:DEAD/DEAH box helicase [Lactobacillus psittaci]|uniref:Snf2 family dna helicase n=1 Tax=Lactobacillus psittaci DSM 15354 TaxID=1122152 RepID=A0A0R1S203_9LACO|nr:DEAD/DEAH box helicase [Lactobacillus psittaci]KRL63068.1 snf2 family dna helicase [Lactobacillus psittaci DSM 15354]
MNPKVIETETGQFQLVDDEAQTLQTRAAQRVIKTFAPYFEDEDAMVFKAELNYVQMLTLIDKLNKKLAKKNLPLVETSQDFNDFVDQRKYAIKEQRDAGIMIKDGNPRWQKEFEEFKRIVANEVSRPLKPEQEKASFFLSVMKRAANFSVPGAGKTAMTYGAFAYLSSPEKNEVDKMLVVCPLNAFYAWQSEFKEVFGDKRQLKVLNFRASQFDNNSGAIEFAWPNINLAIINYESLAKNKDLINRLVDEKTMLVFDEVHRIKGVHGQRAKAALNLSKKPYYRYVLTGTPIPNGYQDIFNFLHIMYPDEYSSFFAWSLNDLSHIDAESVNEKLAPFFWRTNKEDLEVPKPDPDIIYKNVPSEDQVALAESIYEHENGALALYIRLLQASTNPSLLRYNINYQDLGLTEGESKEWDESKTKIERQNISNADNYRKFKLEKMSSPKFERGIKLVKELTSQGKKVLIWGMFVGTMEKITDTLNKAGIKSILIYGGTPKEMRDGLIEQFRHGDVQVLVSNPNTLGESISLHQTVHDAIYFEYNFNLTFMLQSRDRINRLGLPADQYTRYHYLMTEGDTAHASFIDEKVYERLKEKEQVMIDAIDGKMLVPEYTDDYLEEVKKIVMDR